jgi:hypothetical protein
MTVHKKKNGIRWDKVLIVIDEGDEDKGCANKMHSSKRSSK